MSNETIEALEKLSTKISPAPWRVIRYDCGDGDTPDNTPSIEGPDDYDAGIIHWDGFKQKYWSSAHGDERAIDGNAEIIVALRNNLPEIISALKLQECCKEFVREQGIYCAETVYQTDHVIRNAYVFIERVCNIVGYQESEDAE